MEPESKSANRQLSSKPDWLYLAHQASIEPDGNKLLELVRQINDAIDTEEEQKHRALSV